MARKKAEIALQQELETQEEWEEFLSKEGLSVIDVYQDWAGPCKSMISNLKRLKNELGDDLLRFAIAKSDTIDALERYRGKCEPCFMLFAGGVLVAIIRGANAPLIQRTITEQLTYEHKVIDGSAERKEIKDPLLGDLEKEKAALDEEETEKDEEEIEQEVTVCIIKPDAIAAGKKDEILEQLAERGIEVLAQEERQLTEDETKEFYSSHAEEEYFEELVKFMSSGPSYVLVLSKGDAGIIDEFRDLLGPKDVEEAKENAPDSLRALYGTEKLTNALHASDSKDTAHAELAFFFPSFAVPTKTVAKPKKGKKKKKGKKEKAPKIERTLALIRPDALANNKEEILAKIEEAGFQVALQKEIQLTKEQAEEFYKEHVGEEYFDELTTRMSNGPLLALGLARVEAIAGWRDLLGPKEVQVAKTEAPHSLRAQYSFDEDLINPLHGSDSQTKADEELNFFFPMQQTMAVIKPDAYQTKDDIMNKIREAGFRIAARQETELNSEVVEAIYKDHKDKDYFNDLSDHMTSGPTLFMVLSRNDAVEGWRSLMGPTDPEKAKEENPECIRAAFGTDIKANAVHGASDETQAQADIKLLFGEIEFNTDGTVKGEETGLENETVEQASSEEEEEEEDEEEEAGEGEEGEEQREGEEGEAQEREEGGEDAEQRPASAAGATGEGEEQKEGEEGAEPSSEADQKQDGEQTAEGEGEQQEGEEPAKEGEGEGEEKGETETAGEKKDEGGEQGEEGAAEPAAKSRPQTGQEKEEPGTLPEGDEQSPEGGEQAAEGGEQAAEGGEQSPEGAEQTAEDGEKPGEGDEKPAEGERPASKTSKAASQKAEDQAGEQQQQEEDKGERPASKTSKAASQKGEDQAGEQQQEEEKEAPPPAEQIESGQADEQKQEQGEEKQETAAEQTEETQAEQTEETQAEQTEETQVEKTEETQAEQTEETQAEQKEETQAEQTEETQVEKTEETQAEQTEETQAEQTEETQAEQKEEETKEEPAQEQQTEGGGEEQGEQKPAEEQQQQQEGEQEAEKGGEGEQSEQKDDAPEAGEEAADDKKEEEKKEGDETETKKD